MKRVCLLIVTLCVLLSACNKGETNMLNVPSGSILVLDWDTEGTTTFDSRNITSLSPTSVPEGWSVVNIDMYEGTITVKSPQKDDENAVSSGTMTLKGYTPTGGTRSLDIFLAIVSQKDFTASPANCYVATEAQHRYIFNPMIGGSSTPLETAEIRLLWQTKSNLIKYLDMRENGDGKMEASFYLEEDEDNEDSEGKKVYAGNALIGAYNADGEIIWSWHIWVTNNNPMAVENTAVLNGQTMMSINLGAEHNSNDKTDWNRDDESPEDIYNVIYKSYGMYYQWGRKDPFVGPRDYKFTGNYDAKLYDTNGYEVYLNYVESTASEGTIAWATANPTSLIKGSVDNGYDWLYANYDNELWSADSKTEYDPCPAGWRVADASLFAGLTITEEYDSMPLEVLQPRYGLMLTDGTAEYFFTAQGRRNYLDCRLDIFNANDTLPVPWSGYYWTTTTDDAKAIALYFDLNTNTRNTWNKVVSNHPMQRANALPVRCVRDQL